jgi:hypothetical protein
MVNLSAVIYPSKETNMLTVNGDPEDGRATKLIYLTIILDISQFEQQN